MINIRDLRVGMKVRVAGWETLRSLSWVVRGMDKFADCVMTIKSIEEDGFYGHEIYFEEGDGCFWRTEGLCEIVHDEEISVPPEEDLLDFLGVTANKASEGSI